MSENFITITFQPCEFEKEVNINVNNNINCGMTSRHNCDSNTILDLLPFILIIFILLNPIICF